jgi:Uncharacterized bacitracin resistance protein
VTLLQAVVLGVVQGLAAFLPVSATAHLRIVPAIFGWHFYHGSSHDPGTQFTGILQLGTAAALVVYFWRELLQVTIAWFRGHVDRRVRGTLEYRMGWYLVLATVPFAVLGLVFRDRLRTGARNLWLDAAALIAFAVLLLAAERFGRRKRVEEQINITDAVVAAVGETLGLIPGASRPGTMIAAGLFRGMTREAAVRFAFLLSIPGVVILNVYGAVVPGKSHTPGAGLTGIAVVLAFVVGLVALHWFMRWLTHHGTYVFVWYRLALGGVLLGLLGTGVLDATK